jgi:hypothetical protein
MKEAPAIAGYCSIKDDSVILDDKHIYKGSGKNFAEFSADVYRHFEVSYPKFHKMDMLSRLGFLTSELLIREHHGPGSFNPRKTGIILMNSSSSLDTDRNHQKTIADRSDYFPSPAVFVYTLPNVVIGEICIRHRITGEGNFFIMERFNADFMVNYVSRLFADEIIECCITGWVEIDGPEYGSTLYLIRKNHESERGIANFEAAAAKSIFNRK